MLEFDFVYDGLDIGTLAFDSTSGIGPPGPRVLEVDGKVAATQTMEHTAPPALARDENLDAGPDSETPVDDRDDQMALAFAGTIRTITFTVGRPMLCPEEDEQRLRATQRGNRARQ